MRFVRFGKPIVWMVLGMVIGAAASRAVGVVKAAQTPYKVIIAPRSASDLEGTLNSNATLGWRLRAMDGGFVVFEK